MRFCSYVGHNQSSYSESLDDGRSIPAHISKHLSPSPESAGQIGNDFMKRDAHFFLAPYHVLELVRLGRLCHTASIQMCPLCFHSQSMSLMFAQIPYACD